MYIDVLTVLAGWQHATPRPLCADVTMNYVAEVKTAIRLTEQVKAAG
jgi:hypothetical protein